MGQQLQLNDMHFINHVITFFRLAPIDDTRSFALRRYLADTVTVALQVLTVCLHTLGAAYCHLEPHGFRSIGC